MASNIETVPREVLKCEKKVLKAKISHSKDQQVSKSSNKMVENTKFSAQ